MKLLKKLCETPAIPGREQALIDIMKAELEPLCQSVTVDGMGNVIAYKKGSGRNRKKVMIAAHMDEIGFVVTHIDSSGFIWFSPRGGHLPRVLISQRVSIIGKKKITGIVEASPPPFISCKPEDRQNTPLLKDLFIDTGMSEKSLRKVVQIGDPIVLDRPFVSQEEVLISKAFDDRIGCYVMIEALKRLKSHKVDIYAVGTTQEAVGLRVATGAARQITPDMGIAVDITAACDIPGVKPHEQIVSMGKGVAIKINDTASISNHGIVEFLKKTADTKKTPYQLEVLPFGGTDARGMQLFGCGPVCTLSIPTRYAHTPNEMIHKNDVEGAIVLLTHFLESAEKCTLVF